MTRMSVHTYQLVTDEHETSVGIGVTLLGDEAKEPLLCLVISTVGDLVQWILVQQVLCLGLLDGHALHRDGQLYFGRLVATLGLFQLLIELQLLDSLLDHLDTLGLVHLGVA